MGKIREHHQKAPESGRRRLLQSEGFLTEVTPTEPENKVKCEELMVGKTFWVMWGQNGPSKRRQVWGCSGAHCGPNRDGSEA